MGQHDATGQEQVSVPVAFLGGTTTADTSGETMEQETPASPPAPPIELEASDVLSHPRVICDACERHVTGIRYHSLTRHNFDLCEPCMWAEANAGLREGQRWMKIAFVAT